MRSKGKAVLGALALGLVLVACDAEGTVGRSPEAEVAAVEVVEDCVDVELAAEAGEIAAASFDRSFVLFQAGDLSGSASALDDAATSYAVVGMTLEGWPAVSIGMEEAADILGDAADRVRLGDLNGAAIRLNEATAVLDEMTALVAGGLPADLEACR